MNIGGTIKDLRIKKGFNQQEFAVKCKISATSLSQIENGIKRPNPNTLKNICKALGVSESIIYLMSADVNDVPKNKKMLLKHFILQYAE